MANFWEKYRDPRWQRRRLEIMQYAEFACEECGNKEKPLNVHHKLYRKGSEPWEYAAHELQCLCEDCHELTHGVRDQLKEALALLSSAELEIVLGYAKGIYLRSSPEVGVSVNSYEDCEGIGDAFSLSADDVINCTREKTVLSGDLFNVRQQRINEGNK